MTLAWGFYFLSYALAARRAVPMPWLTAELYLVAGLEFVGAMLFRRRADCF